MVRKSAVPVLVLALACCPAAARNPFVEHQGLADPHVHVWPTASGENGSMAYCFATHDLSPNNTGFRMDDWWVWQSIDLVTWTRSSVLKPSKTPAAQKDYTSCWATDAAYRDGLGYFWYISIGSRNIAVMTAPAISGDAPQRAQSKSTDIAIAPARISAVVECPSWAVAR